MSRVSSRSIEEVIFDPPLPGFPPLADTAHPGALELTSLGGNETGMVHYCRAATKVARCRMGTRGALSAGSPVGGDDKARRRDL